MKTQLSSLLVNQFKLEFHRIMAGYIALVAISTMEIFIDAQRSLKNISKKVALELGTKWTEYKVSSRLWTLM